MRFLKQCLLPAIPLVLAALSTPALAAREFTPQSGLWMIPSESNGQPGRGFSLDVQGNTAFLQVFNYEKSGAATFHTALGQLDDSASMTVPLLRFKGGRYLGGPARDAVEDGSAGNVSVKFTDGLNGTIQFPGEEVQPISRFVVPEKWPHWWAQITPSPSLQNKEGWRHMQWTATSPNGVRHVWEAFLFKGENERLWLGLTPQVDGDTSGGAFECRFLTDTQVFDCTTTRRTESGF